MYYINGMSTYAQMQYWQTREAHTSQYLATSQALMSTMTSSMTNLYEGQATLAEKQVLSRIASGSSNGSLPLLIAQLQDASSKDGLVSMLNTASSTSGSTVNLFA